MREIVPSELRSRMDSGDAPEILDIREDWELDRARLEPVTHIPMDDLVHRLDELESDRELVVMCHHGVRSARVVRFLETKGFSHVINLVGGIDAWARDIDRDVPTY